MKTKQIIEKQNKNATVDNIYNTRTLAECMSVSRVIQLVVCTDNHRENNNRRINKNKQQSG